MQASRNKTKLDYYLKKRTDYLPSNLAQRIIEKKIIPKLIRKGTIWFDKEVKCNKISPVDIKKYLKVNFPTAMISFEFIPKLGNLIRYKKWYSGSRKLVICEEVI